MSVALISVSQDTIASNKHEERTRHYYVIFQQSSSSLGRDGGVVALQWCYSLRHVVVVTLVIDRKEGPGYGGGHNQNVIVVAVIIIAVVAVVLWWYGPGHGNLLKVLPRVEVVWVTRLLWRLDKIFNLILYCTYTTSLNSI